MFPGKGAHLVLNQEILDWVQDALQDVGNCYSDDLHDTDPKIVIGQLLDGSACQLDWNEEKDNFGRKAFTLMAYKEGELRVTVVHTKRGELKLDIREWFEGKQ